MIPARFLSKLGDYNGIKIGSVPVSVKYVDNADVINNHDVLPSQSLIGLDFKRLSSTSSSSKRSYDLIILCWEDIFPSSIELLVINLGYMDNVVPNKLKEFLGNANVCVVTPTSLPSTYSWIHSVVVGDLAARAIKKPELIDLGLSDLAHILSVPYEGPTASSPASSSSVKTDEIQVDQKNLKVLTPAQIKTAITEAYTCYKIASKLLHSS